MMNIFLYLDDVHQTLITHFHDLPSNPFSIGDIISLNVLELSPVDYEKYNYDVRSTFIDQNEGLIKAFKLKKVRILRQEKFIDFNAVKSGIITIECFCEIFAHPITTTFA